MELNYQQMLVIVLIKSLCAEIGPLSIGAKKRGCLKRAALFCIEERYLSNFSSLNCRGIIAAKMTWKGMNPIVFFIDKIYQKGVKPSDEELEEINPFIQKDKLLKKWNVKILNKIDW
jgi:hypothetical protein